MHWQRKPFVSYSSDSTRAGHTGTRNSAQTGPNTRSTQVYILRADILPE